MAEKGTWERYIYRISLIASAVVLLFSIYHQYPAIAVALRVVASFFIVYFLGKICIYFWEISGRPAKANNEPINIDFMLGGGNSPEPMQEKTQDEPILPGQINAGMKDGLPDTEVQAEIIKKMGWEGE